MEGEGAESHETHFLEGSESGAISAFGALDPLRIPGSLEEA